jgi:hypothetical protein
MTQSHQHPSASSTLSSPNTQCLYLPFSKQIQQSNRLWTAINHFDFSNEPIHTLQQLIALAFVLEDWIQFEAQSIGTLHNSSHISPPHTTTNVIADTINYYSQPNLRISPSKKSYPSLTSQLFSPSRISSHPIPDNNYFASLQDYFNCDADI